MLTQGSSSRLTKQCLLFCDVSAHVRSYQGPQHTSPAVCSLVHWLRLHSRLGVLSFYRLILI
jgi:hypothetical protein